MDKPYLACPQCGGEVPDTCLWYCSLECRDAAEVVASFGCDICDGDGFHRFRDGGIWRSVHCRVCDGTGRLNP